MEHSHGGLDAGPVDGSAWFLVLRLVLLLATALVAGAGLVRPRVEPLPGRARSAVVAAAAVSAGLALVSVAVLDVNVVGAAAHVLLVLAVPMLFVRPVAARWASVALVLLLVLETAVGRSGAQLLVDGAYVAASVAWFGAAFAREAGAARGPRPGLPVLGAVLVLAGGARLLTSGVAFDRRLVDTALGLVLLAAVALPPVAVLLSTKGRRYGTAVVVAAFTAWGALAAVPQPAELPVPGVPVLADATLAGRHVPVLVSPHRPGRNLVHLPAGAGTGLVVAVGDREVPAVPVEGAEGTWAEVDLPAGRGAITVRAGGDSASVDVDPGTEPGPGLGADAPECASAALGGLLAGRREVLAACPADGLAPEDEAALGRLVSFLGERGAGGIVLAADDSPRGTRAARVVREAAAGIGLRVDDEAGPDTALVAVSGWAVAHRALSAAAAAQAERPVHGHGLYLAPWLLTTPLATAATTVSAPLGFDPREPLPVGYAVAVGNGFGGENPTPAGFRSWLGGREPSSGGVRLYAVAQVTAMPMGPDEVHAPGMPMTEELAGQWIPKATVVPVSGPLV
ncbi:hypothetical protein [Saccharothrix syringae]|uniref:hypothetical protein n=1 Tax=Saccharothrix syringae TaxID=103733 RepID=UPI0005270FF6|nr:hypothetical protein [Saccharothrix syringae]